MYLIYFSYAHCILFLSATTTGSSDMTRFSDCSTTTLAELLLLTNRKNGPIWTQFTVKPSDVCIPIIFIYLYYHCCYLGITYACDKNNSQTHLFFVISNDCAIQPLTRMPCCQRIRKPALAQIVFIFVNDKRPPNHR